MDNKKLTKILSLHEDWLEDHSNGEFANLEGANLAGANLADANLKHCCMAYAELRGSSLKGARLAGANLTGTALVGANLAGANLEGANLPGANLAGANLAGAFLTGANLEGANLIGTNLTGVDLERVNLTNLGGWCLPLKGGPCVPNIHQNLYQVMSRPNALDMSLWHSPCGTTHCLAGWIVTLAGDQGKELETLTSTAMAAYQIYYKSDRFGLLGSVDFYTPDDESVLHKLQQLAELEREKVEQEDS